MDSEPDRELQVIREQTHQTRAHLAEKLEALESQISQTVSGVTTAVENVQSTFTDVTTAVESVAGKVTDTVSSLTESVAGTVSNLSETVSGTVNSVTDTVTSMTDTVTNVTQSLDPTPKIQAAPWTAVGLAVAAGFAGGYIFGGPRRSFGAPPTSYGEAPAAPAPTPSYTNGRNGSSNGHQQATAFDAVGGTLGEIGEAARSLGVSAIMGVVARLAESAVPEAMKNDVTGALDKLKTRLGGHHDVPPDFLNALTGKR